MLNPKILAGSLPGRRERPVQRQAFQLLLRQVISKLARPQVAYPDFW